MEALTLQATLRGNMARGERVTTPNAKFAALAEDWYDSKRLLRPWTLKDYRAALDNVLLPRFGNLKLASITPDRIAALIRELEHKGYPAIGSQTSSSRSEARSSSPCAEECSPRTHLTC
jgi:integrase